MKAVAQKWWSEKVEVKLFARCSLLVTFYLLLITFCSLLVTFCSLLVTFCSLLVTFCLLLVTFCSLLVTFCSLLVTFCSLLVTFCSLLVTFCSLLVTFCSLIVTFCSLLVTFCSLLVTFWSIVCYDSVIKIEKEHNRKYLNYFALASDKIPERLIYLVDKFFIFSFLVLLKETRMWGESKISSNGFLCLV